LIGQVTQDVPVKLVSVEIRAVEDGTLVTAIAILSPVNKRPGHEAFRQYDRTRRSLMRREANVWLHTHLKERSALPGAVAETATA
jgi:hypothetical protein